MQPRNCIYCDNGIEQNAADRQCNVLLSRSRCSEQNFYRECFISRTRHFEIQNIFYFAIKAYSGRIVTNKALGRC